MNNLGHTSISGNFALRACYAALSQGPTRKFVQLLKRANGTGHIAYFNGGDHTRLHFRDHTNEHGFAVRRDDLVASAGDEAIRLLHAGQDQHAIAMISLLDHHSGLQGDRVRREFGYPVQRRAVA